MAPTFPDDGDLATKKQKLLPIDEADYLVLEKILQCMGFECGEGFQPLMKILNDDKERRIRTLHRKAGQKSHLVAKILHPSFGQLQAVRELTLIDLKSLKTLPEEIGNFSNLISLELRESGITSLPTSIGRLHALRELKLVNMKLLKPLPEEIGHLGNLISLDLRESGITSLPASIGRLHKLKVLDLFPTGITFLPEEIGNLGKLKRLKLSAPRITSLPASIGRLHNLELLTFCSARITSLPEEIGSLGKKLEVSVD